MKKIFIISDLGTNIGLGHYSRSLVLTKEIKYYLKNKTKIFNYYFHWKNSQNLGFRTVSNKKLNQYILKKINQHSPNVVCFNVSRFLEPKLYNFISLLKKNYPNIKLVAIDGFLKKTHLFKKIWIPNVTLKSKKDFKNKKIIFGWDKILINRFKEKNKRQKSINVLFTIGGTDRYKIGDHLPQIAEKTFEKKIKLIWVQGPYASRPKISSSKRWTILKNRTNLKPLYKKIDFAFVVFGVSFFEIISQSIPSVLFFHKKKIEDIHLIKYLKKKLFDVTSNLETAVSILNYKIKNYKKSKQKAKKLKQKIKFKNRKKIIKELFYD